MSIQKGYEVAELTYAKRNPQTVQISDGARARKTDDGYVLEVLSAGLEWQGLDFAGVRKPVSVTLTNAQIKALPTTAVPIVPAKGANTIIVPMFAWLYLHWVADYDNIGDACVLGIRYAGGGEAPTVALHEQISEVSNLLVDGASHPAYLAMRSMPFDYGAGSLRSSGVGQFADDPGSINKGLEIYAVNAGSHTGDFTSGDAGNTLAVSIPYMVFDISTGAFQ